MSEQAARKAPTLVGHIEKIPHLDEKSGFAIALVAPEGRADRVKAVFRASSGLKPGLPVELAGAWRDHPAYGRQFEVTTYRVVEPTSAEALVRYLGSGLIPGIGKPMAKRIVEVLGAECLEKIRADPACLARVPGIGRKRAAEVGRALEQLASSERLLLWLKDHDVTENAVALKIHKAWGRDAIAKIRENPYRLTEIPGIGFRRADVIALKAGWSLDDPRRLSAGIHHSLKIAHEEGHCYLPESKLVERARADLRTGALDALREAVAAETGAGRLRAAELPGGERAVYLPRVYEVERELARRLVEFARQPVDVNPEKVDAALADYARQSHVVLTAEQRAAVHTAVRSRLSIITGGPGVGKTTALRALVAVFRALRRQLALASPTGRAAQRLETVVNEGLPETAHHKARTIHRLLGFEPGNEGFRHREGNPLPEKAIIIDETSMVDLELAGSLLSALDASAQLVLVGDADQLASVGAGSFFRSVIESADARRARGLAAVPVARLTRVFRQAESSLIIRNAHSINTGQMPELVRPDGRTRVDCYFIEETEDARVTELVVRVVTSSLPKRFGYDPLRDIQVLAPMKAGVSGTVNLNTVLQEALNPPGAGRAELATRGGRIYRAGDRVLQIVNDYGLEVFNGDSGTILRIDRERSEMVIDFAGRLVRYPFSDLAQLTHGFAMTVHKAQGSEFPAVVIPVHSQHWRMLTRNGLYTALTRAKRTCVLIGTRKALRKAVETADDNKRFTRLGTLLDLS